MICHASANVCMLVAACNCVEIQGAKRWPWVVQVAARLQVAAVAVALRTTWLLGWLT